MRAHVRMYTYLLLPWHFCNCCSIDKATATLSDTIDFLAKNVQAGVVIDFEHPAEEDPRLSSGSNSWNDLKLFI